MFVVHWNGEEIARHDRAVSLEGALYFPPEAVRLDVLKPASETSFCEWKDGHAEYFDIHINSGVNEGAVWRYSALGNPSVAVIIGWYSFWKDVRVEWVGEGEPNIKELAFMMPNVAKALGVAAVEWRSTPPFLDAGEVFTGYIIPDLNIAVDVLADPGAKKRAAVVSSARDRAQRCLSYAKSREESGHSGYGYIAVWGSAPPSPEAVDALTSGRSVLALESEAEIIG